MDAQGGLVSPPFFFSCLSSRLVVERSGAEALLRKGDLLFKALGDPVRLQSPYVTEADLRGVLRPR